MELALEWDCGSETCSNNLRPGGMRACWSQRARKRLRYQRIQHFARESRSCSPHLSFAQCGGPTKTHYLATRRHPVAPSHDLGLPILPPRSAIFPLASKLEHQCRPCMALNLRMVDPRRSDGWPHQAPWVTAALDITSQNNPLGLPSILCCLPRSLVPHLPGFDSQYGPPPRLDARHARHGRRLWLLRR